MKHFTIIFFNDEGGGPKNKTPNKQKNHQGSIMKEKEMIKMTVLTLKKH